FFEKEHPVYLDIKNLFREYSYASPHLKVEYVDPDRDPGRSKALTDQYGIKEANVVIFDNGVRNRFVTTREIFDFKYAAKEGGSPPAPLAFKGEQAFSSAIYEIGQTQKPVVYFLSGHGEKDIELFDQKVGYSSINRFLQRDHIEVRTLVLGEATEVPADCETLIIAGPKFKISQPELDVIGAYLERNGRALIMLDALTRTGLEPLMEKWGIGLYPDVVVDRKRTRSRHELFIFDYGDHPISRELAGIASLFYLPRSVIPLNLNGNREPDQDTADKPRVIPLASSSANGWAERNIERNPMKFDPGADRQGPVSIAVAVEKGLERVDMKIRPTRLVVFGDSE
ncbi:MAG: GldG family protein, partial [Verrucomicrobiota bacterium]